MNSSILNITEASPPLQYFDDLFISFYFISSLFGLPTQSYILWLILKERQKGGTVLSFNLNLTVCELGKSLNSSLILFIRFTSFKGLEGTAEFFIGLGITGCPLFQCLMCLERYLAVVHPVTFLKYKPLRYRVFCCALAWIFTLGSCVVCMLYIGWFYVYVWFYLTQFLCLLPIMLFCCLAVLRALKQSGPGDKKKEEENQMKRRAFFLILITTLNMLFYYLPYTITGIFFIMTQNYIRPLFSISFLLNVLASFVHPVVYLHQTGKLLCLCSP